MLLPYPAMPATTPSSVAHLRPLERAEAQRVQERDGAGAHREDVLMIPPTPVAAP